MNANITVNCI